MDSQWWKLYQNVLGDTTHTYFCKSSCQWTFLCSHADKEYFLNSAFSLTVVTPLSWYFYMVSPACSTSICGCYRSKHVRAREAKLKYLHIRLGIKRDQCVVGHCNPLVWHFQVLVADCVHWGMLELSPMSIGVLDDVGWSPIFIHNVVMAWQLHEYEVYEHHWAEEDYGLQFNRFSPILEKWSVCIQ